MENKLDKHWNRFIHMLTQASAEDDLDELLQMLLTADERESIVTRLHILQKLLEKESSQRAISQQLGVGIATVTRGSNELKKHSPHQINKLKRYLLD